MIESYLQDFLNSLLEDRYGMSSQKAIYIEMLIVLGTTLLIMVLLYYVSKFILRTLLPKATARTKTSWDDRLVERHFFARVSHFIPALYLKWVAPVIFSEFPTWQDTIERITSVYITIVLLRILFSFLNAARDVIGERPSFQDKPLQSYLQLIKIIFGFIGGIIILSIIISKNPIYIVTGLGAVSAVLILVFKDTILGFVASIQLSMNDMLRIGDWVSVPKYGADGPVMEINLTTVKVQNWDKTITTVPTYSFIADSFKNWRGMEESGGRRMVRTISIKVDTVKFVDEELLERLSKFQILKSYLEERKAEIEQYNKEHNVDTSSLVNGRRMTNVGTFRRYLLALLENNENVNHDMIYMVRALEPTEEGIGLQVYCFLKEKRWIYYESIQSDIFDHVLAVVKEFDLEIHEAPTGTDIQQGITTLSSSKTEDE